VNSRIRSLSASYQQIRLKQPFVLSIRSTLHANIVSWSLETEDGEMFHGECVPVQYVTGETVESTLALAPVIEEIIKGQRIADWIAIARELERRFPDHPAARAGVEMALLNAFSAKSGITPHMFFGSANATLETDLTIARIPNALDVAREAYKDGFQIFKLKVGGGQLQEDVDRITIIHDALPDVRFRLDANQALTPQTAMELLESLQASGVRVELLEQPVPKEDLAALDEISRMSSVPIIADEACRNAREAFRLLSQTRVHGINIKLMKSGILGALDTIAVARAAGCKLMIGCMLEGERGMAISVALAAGTGAFDYIDLDGHLLIDLGHMITMFESDGPMLRV
jgi:L-alanine-DL-glutamate epimerase-like enolase superfamily enzyme